MKCPQCGKMVVHDAYTNSWVDGEDRMWMSCDFCGYIASPTEWRASILQEKKRE